MIAAYLRMTWGRQIVTMARSRVSNTRPGVLGQRNSRKTYFAWPSAALSAGTAGSTTSTRRGRNAATARGGIAETATTACAIFSVPTAITLSLKGASGAAEWAERIRRNWIVRGR